MARRSRRATEGDGVFMRGLLEDSTMVVDMISFMHSARRTGKLTLTKQTVIRSIYFSTGDVIAASSNQPEDRFGAVLRRQGGIDQATLDQLLAQAARDRRKIGNLLLASGALTAQGLWQVVRCQIQEIFYSALLCDTGIFTVAHFDPAQVPTRTPLHTQHLLLEGLRRRDEMEKLRGELPADDQMLALAGARPQITEVPGADAILSLLDSGPRTMAEISEKSGLGPFELPRLVHNLIHLKLIREVDQPSGAANNQADVIIRAFNDCFQLVYQRLTQQAFSQRFIVGIEHYFKDLGQSLFDGVTVGPDGRLPAERIYLNLKISTGTDKLKHLRAGLYGYLQFLLFLARESLDYDEVERLADEVQRRVEPFAP